jgi:hypothetical protein
MAANTVAAAMFTRRHYTAVADAINGTPTGGYIAEREADRQLVTDALAAMFTEDNPRFDRGRFVRACGIGSGRIAGMGAGYCETPLFGGAAQ